MRANISDELMNAINDRIYLDLMLHVAQTRYTKAVNEGNEANASTLDNVWRQIKEDRNELNNYLKKYGVKIYDAEKDADGEFLEYPYVVKVAGGGYKEGTMRYWRAAIKKQLNEKIRKYFK